MKIPALIIISFISMSFRTSILASPSQKEVSCAPKRTERWEPSSKPARGEVARLRYLERIKRVFAMRQCSLCEAKILGRNGKTLFIYHPSLEYLNSITTEHLTAGQLSRVGFKTLRIRTSKEDKADCVDFPIGRRTTWVFANPVNVHAGRQPAQETP